MTKHSNGPKGKPPARPNEGEVHNRAAARASAGRHGRQSQRGQGGRVYLLLGAMVVVVGAVIALWYGANSGSSTASNTYAQQGTGASVPAGDSASLATDVIWPAYVLRGSAAVKESYQFAVARPDVLSYMPCYCGCAGDGHRSNKDCFIGNYNQGGSTITFDTHGAT